MSLLKMVVKKIIKLSSRDFEFLFEFEFFYIKNYKYISTNLQALHLHLSAWSTTLKMFAFKKILIARDKGAITVGRLGLW